MSPLPRCFGSTVLRPGRGLPPAVKQMAQLAQRLDRAGIALRGFLQRLDTIFQPLNRVLARLRQGRAQLSLDRAKGSWGPSYNETRSCRFDNHIPVPLSEETDRIAWAIDNNRKEVGDVAAEDAHVQSFGLGECGECPPEQHGAAVFTA